MIRIGRPARAVVAALTATLLTVTVGVAPAAGHGEDPVLRNGGFERGWLGGWGHRDQADSNGTWQVHEGTSGPVSGLRIPAPPEGRSQAVVDQNGPGSHLLFRRIEVDDDDLALRLTFWYRNRAEEFFSPRTLRYDRVANQQFRIDLLRPGARLDSMADRAILATPFRTTRDSRINVGPRTITVDLSRFEGRDVRLRIAEVDNLFFFQAGVDAVELVRGHHARAVSAEPKATSLSLRERQARPAPVGSTYSR